MPIKLNLGCGGMTFEELEFAARSSYNVIEEVDLQLEVRK